MAEKGKNIKKVPNLRFPGFKGDWNTYKLGEIADFSKGKGVSKSDIDENGINECIRYGELYTHYREVISEVKSRTNIDKNNLVLSRANDVIIPASGETQIDIATASCVLKDGVVLGGDLNIIRTPNNGVFLSYYLNSKKKMEIANLTQGISVVHLYASQLATLEINLPALIEQNKTASFLSMLDERIQTQSKIIEGLKSLIIGTVQNLESSGQRRGWKHQFLYEILTERKEANSDKYPVHSVSVSMGVINQIEYLGRSFAAKNTTHYNVVHFGDIVYTKSPTGNFPYGIIKQSFVSEKVAVSPLYGVFIPKNVYVGNILHYYFSNSVNANNYLRSLIQKGAKNTINISNQDFLDKAIYLPTDATQMKNVAELLNKISEKINIEETFLKKLKAQKQYLLQNLFI